MFKMILRLQALEKEQRGSSKVLDSLGRFGKKLWSEALRLLQGFFKGQ